MFALNILGSKRKASRNLKMVYKTGKYGTNSGNTFRTRNIKFNHNYSNSAFLIRSHIGDSQDRDFYKTGAFGEGNALSDNVAFSLNKQRRWELPEVLENLILNGLDAEEYGVQVVTHHKVKQSANCVSVVATDGVYNNGDIDKNSKFKIKNSGGYFQLNSAIQGKSSVSKRRRRANRRRQLRPRPEDPNDNDTPGNEERCQIRYEVLLPCPSTSYLAYEAKKVGMETRKPYVWTGYQDSNSKHRRRGNLNGHINECIDIMNDELLYDSEEDYSENESVETGYASKEKDYTMALSDLIVHAKTANYLLRQRRVASTGSEGDETDTRCNTKGRIFVENNHTETDSSQTSTEIKSQRKERYVESSPVSIILSNDDTCPDFLSDRFGNACFEAMCFPRKFVLDISERIRGIKEYNTYRRNDIRTTAFLVFVHDADNEMNTEKESVYQVHLNANFKGGLIRSTRIETIFDYMETHVEEVIERTLFYVETLPVNALFVDKPVPDHRICKSTTTVEQCLKWTTQTYIPNDNFLIQYIRTEQSNVCEEAESLGYEIVSVFDTAMSDDLKDVTCQHGRLCSICFEELSQSSRGTALMACSHWFCDCCWKEYINTQISEGVDMIECPEFDCSREVDIGSMISLVNAKQVIRYSKHCHDNKIEKQTVTCWCPNSACRRVIKLSTPEVKFAACSCGTRFCVDCLSSSHWPAPCSKFSDYTDRMRKSGDSSLLPPEAIKPITVNGKNCPNCHRFVEKNGGCPYMYCICRTAFCWGCGHLWSSRSHGSSCYKNGQNDKHNTKVYTVQADQLSDKKRHGWYKQALQHRVNQHPARISKLSAAVRGLTKQVQTVLVKSAQKGEPISLDIADEDPNNTFTTSQRFLRNTVSMYVEMNNIVENTSVLFNSDELDSVRRQKLQNISRRLSTFVELIFGLLVSDAKGFAEVKEMVERLVNIRYHSRNAIRSLVKNVNAL
ncbi:ARI1-like protein [Mya arenaria]|uniref:RBR-type E3 ubiquitin transferase n=1 Tax=Mya arenaria TaxID=6604 RepID=A0ABY7DW57_MYAAR|nr:uncharacterized protein LOC128226693 [Mya arenaria]WAR00880.1 ARI1-like protein [Mya arenaria]